jgi:hypothetical protein
VVNDTFSIDGCNDHFRNEADIDTAWKTVCVLTSSTFRDMHAARGHLVTVVFPESRERVKLLGLEFFDPRLAVPVL